MNENDRLTCVECGGDYHVTALVVDGEDVALCEGHAWMPACCVVCGNLTMRRDCICAPCQTAADEAAEREVELEREAR